MMFFNIFVIVVVAVDAAAAAAAVVVVVAVVAVIAELTRLMPGNEAFISKKARDVFAVPPYFSMFLCAHRLRARPLLLPNGVHVFKKMRHSAFYCRCLGTK